MKFIIKTASLENLANLVEQVAKDEAVKIATDLYPDLVMNTPVDTGALRQAWQLDTSIDNPTIVNDLPYAHRVMETGHSKQAPPGTLTAIIDKHTQP